MFYLSQEGEMLNNQMCALRFPRTTLPADYDTLKQRDKEPLHYLPLRITSLSSDRVGGHGMLGQTKYLVFAECHHAPVGSISSSKDVWRVVSPLHTMVQLRELRNTDSTLLSALILILQSLRNYKCLHQMLAHATE